MKTARSASSAPAGIIRNGLRTWLMPISLMVLGAVQAQTHVEIDTHKLSPGQHVEDLPEVDRMARSFLDFKSYEAWKLSQAAAQQRKPAAAGKQQPPVNPDHGQAKGGGGNAGICECWHEPDASYTLVDNETEWDAGGFQNADDGSYGPITLPFSFFLYGQYWTEAYININGNVSFGTPYPTYSASGFPVSGFTMVAPFWADVMLTSTDCSDCNKVEYKLTNTALYVNWTRVGYFNDHADKVNTFQLIISDGVDPVIPNGANVSFCYKDMQWTTGDASQGVDGFGGVPASVGANQGDGINYLQFGRFDHEGTDYDGPEGAADGVSWLDAQYFSFATDVTTGNVPPVLSGQSVCTELTICTGQQVDLAVSFYGPEPDQTVVANSSSDIPSYSIVSNTTGPTADISTTFFPDLSDVGDHTIQFTGTDNGTPSLTTVLNITIHILPNPGGIPVITGDATPCIGEGTVLTAVGNYSEYSWDNGYNGDMVLVGPGTYTVTGGTGGCSFTSDPFVVTEVPLPNTPVIDGVLFNCGGDPTVLGTTESYATYNWSNGSQDPSITVGTGTYSVTVANSEGCQSSSAPVNVITANNPIPSFSTLPPGAVDVGTTVLYTSTTDPNGTTIVSSVWNVDTIGSGTGNEFSQFYTTPGEYIVTLTVTTSDGCSTTYQYTQVVRPTDIIAPNVFSPNNDGKNDVLEFQGAQFYPNTSLKVFNRWGQEVFSSGNYKNTWKGQDMPEGTYFYVLKLSESGKEYTGHVTLLR